jgi:hypothetical protein
VKYVCLGYYDKANSMATFEPSCVDTVRSGVYIRPATVSPRHLALSGSIFPTLPADKLFPAIHQEFTTNRIQQQVFAVIERTFAGNLKQ